VGGALKNSWKIGSAAIADGRLDEAAAILLIRMQGQLA
jgi:hypothetical protein